MASNEIVMTMTKQLEEARAMVTEKVSLTTCTVSVSSILALDGVLYLLLTRLLRACTM